MSLWAVDRHSTFNPEMKQSCEGSEAANESFHLQLHCQLHALKGQVQEAVGRQHAAESLKESAYAALRSAQALTASQAEEHQVHNSCHWLASGCMCPSDACSSWCLTL
jgi:hypothetical protein